MLVSDEAFELLVKPKEENEPHAVEWTVPSNLPYFNGHFPGNPVLPGVAIIDVSLACIRKISNTQSKKLPEFRSSKFKLPVRPQMTLTILVTPHPNEVWDVLWRVKGGEHNSKEAASLRLKL